MRQLSYHRSLQRAPDILQAHSDTVLIVQRPLLSHASQRRQCCCCKSQPSLINAASDTAALTNAESDTTAFTNAEVDTTALTDSASGSATQTMLSRSCCADEAHPLGSNHGYRAAVEGRRQPK